jgi:hypothetical protein
MKRPVALKPHDLMQIIFPDFCYHVITRYRACTTSRDLLTPSRRAEPSLILPIPTLPT